MIIFKYCQDSAVKYTSTIGDKMNCDLCGKVEDSLVKTNIEGVELDVCSACSKFGKVIAPVHRPSPKEQHKQFQSHAHAKEKVELLVEGYASIIKKLRESKGLTQKDFANKINEKESTIHHIEIGSLEPNLQLAKKLEKALGVKLTEQYEERHESHNKKKDEGFTLGDFIKIKR